MLEANASVNSLTEAVFLTPPPHLSYINRGGFCYLTASVNLLTEAIARRAARRLLTEAVREHARLRGLF